MELDTEACRRAVQSKDARFDGVFFSAVVTTGIYCRPSCPATPKIDNVRFYPSAAAAQGAGFRACKRCRPDASPGSPEWNERGDVVARAMRLIADGVVDRQGVDGVARRLGYSARHLHRQLVAEAGPGPQALARAQRGQTARILLETTDLNVTAVAFASGLQQRAPVQRHRPGHLRHQPLGPASRPATQRAPHLRRAGASPALRRPFHRTGLLDFLGARAVAGVEEADAHSYRRSLVLPHGEGVIEVEPTEDNVAACSGSGMSAPASRGPPHAPAPRPRRRPRSRRHLPRRRCAPRSPGGAAPRPASPRPRGRAELALRAVLGQQVSVAGARTVTARLVALTGSRSPHPSGITHAFPSADTLAGVDPAELPLPAGRVRTLVGLARALAYGDIVLDDGADRSAAAAELERLPGVGPWTAEYVTMRALGDPDVLVATDLGVETGARRPRRSRLSMCRGGPGHPLEPRRSYATVHLWAHGHADDGGEERVASPTRRETRPQSKQPQMRRGAGAEKESPIMTHLHRRRHPGGTPGAHRRRGRHHERPAPRGPSQPAPLIPAGTGRRRARPRHRRH